MAEGSGKPDRTSGPEYGAWLRRAYLDDGMTVGEIGAVLGRGECEVRRDLRELGIRKQAPYRPWTDPEFAGEVLDMYGGGKNVMEIADVLGCSRNSVRQVLLSSDAKPRKIPQSSDPLFLAWLQNAYIREGKSAGEIADELGCRDVTVLNRLYDAGITVRQSGRKLPSEDDAEFREWLREEYLEKGISSADIAARLGCSGSLVRARLVKYGFMVKGKHMMGTYRPAGIPGVKQDARGVMAGMLGHLLPNDVQVFHFDGDAGNDDPDNLFAVAAPAGMAVRNVDRWLGTWTAALRARLGRDVPPAEPVGSYGVTAGEKGMLIMADVLEHDLPEGLVVGYANNWPGDDRVENLFVSTAAGYAAYAEHCRKRDAEWLGYAEAGCADVPGRPSGPPFDEWLTRMFLDGGVTTTRIGEIIGCTEPSVCRKLARLGLSRRGHREDGPVARRPGLDGDLRRMYVDEGMGMAEIGEALGCSEGYVGYLLAGRGIRQRNPLPMTRDPLVREELTRLCGEGAKMSELKARFGCSESHIRRMMRDLGLTGRDSPGRLENRPGIRDDVVRMYVGERMSIGGIAKELGCSWNRAKKLVASLGLEREARDLSSWGPFADDPDREELLKAELRRLYVDEGLSLSKTGEVLGMHMSTVWNKLRKYGISREQDFLSEREGIREDLVRMYVDERMTPDAIGCVLGCKGSYVVKLLHKFGIRRGRLRENA